jgi:hypothetical protein
VNKEEHPRGLSPEDRFKWDFLGKLMMALYNKTSGDGDLYRNILACHDDNDETKWMLLFTGSKEDVNKIRELLYDQQG